MAKKFVRINGLHSIFDTGDTIYNTSSLSESVDPNIISELSVCFITADGTDHDYYSGYSGTYIWTHGILFPCKETSGLTQDVAELVQSMSEKQDALIAGDNIEISGNTISAIDNMAI